MVTLWTCAGLICVTDLRETDNDSIPDGSVSIMDI